MNALTYLAAATIALLPLGQSTSTSVLTHLTAALPAIHPAQDQVTAPYRATILPVKTGGQELKLGANVSAYAIDLESNQTLYSQNADKQRPIASVTKIVTALVIMHRHTLDEKITIPTLPRYTSADEVIGLKAGDTYQIRDLLAALMINSANDAADALAISDSGSKEAFAGNMNQYVQLWGIDKAHFSNPSGLSDKDNGASAEALAKLASLALHNTTFTRLINTKQTSITSVDGTATNIKTTNTLLQNGQFSGIKTGYTLAAGQCFVGLTSVQGHKVITVILGSQDRFGDTTRLADWINVTYRWQ